MKNNVETKKTQTPKTPKAAREPADRLPATVEELKAGKSVTIGASV